MAGGVVAAGHPRSAEAGASVLRAGGNAVDAALAAVLASCTAEVLLNGLGAGGYLLVAGFDEDPVLLDFFVAAPGEGGDGAVRGELLAVDVDFGDAHQLFHCGAASVGTWGVPAGVCAAARRWGTVPLAELTAPAAALARDGEPLNDQQAFVFALLEGILTSSPEAAALFAPGGRLLRTGETFRWAELGDALERLGAEGEAPFYTGDLAAAAVAFLQERGAVLTAADLERYEAVPRAPVEVTYRGRRVLTNPPPNAGGVLIAEALLRLQRAPATGVADLVEVMEAVQAGRDEAFVAGLDDPGFAASRLGSTTHVSVLDGEGRAAAVTCTNGEGCGLVVPGTGLHPNNIMGELDLNPFGFHGFPPRRRMPSMMAPTVVLSESGEVDVVLGSAGSNRIRSAILQTIVGVVDRGLPIRDAVEAPRLHVENAGEVFAEPGLDTSALAGRDVVTFRERNLFFGGVQAVQRGGGGAGDPRRGGAAVEA